MKTILYSLAVVVSCFFMAVNASAQYGLPPHCPPPYPPSYNDDYRDGRMQSFYYYPQSNVYYNPAAGRYIFYSRNAWVVSDRLPYYYRVRREPRFVVYHNGFDVWNDNRMHCMKYRDYRRNAPDIAYDRNNQSNGYGYPDNSYPDNDYNGYPGRRDDRRK